MIRSIPRRSLTRASTLGLALTLVTLTGGAWAQGAWPNKPIRVVVPFAAGSTTDIIARAISDKMSQSLGQQLVVDNRGGASGTNGQGMVANAEADGYTATKHQREVGTGYFDQVTQVIAGANSSITALKGSTEAEQFQH